jgi:hypothetical protein
VAIEPMRSHEEQAMSSVMEFDLTAVIMAAKLGRTRRDAQEDTCSVFAAALYDILRARGIACRMFTASPTDCAISTWYHCVVKVGRTYYDSMGEFSEAIYRARAKIHPKSTLTITYKRDSRIDCYESDFEEMYAFYVKMLTKAMDKALPNRATVEPDRVSEMEAPGLASAM